MSMRTLGCGGTAVMNDDTADLFTPIMSVANRISDFGPVQIEDLLSKVMVIRNAGQVPLQWFFENSGIIQSTAPWLHFSPFDGALTTKQESKVSVMLDCRLLHAELLRRTEGTAADNVDFEDVVVLRVRGGEEFRCVISGTMKMNRSQMDTAERSEYESTCNSSVSSANDEIRQVDDEEGGSEIRPTEGMASVAPRGGPGPGPGPSMFSNLFTIMSNWTKPNRTSPVNARDAIAAANVAGFL